MVAVCCATCFGARHASDGRLLGHAEPAHGSVYVTQTNAALRLRRFQERLMLTEMQFKAIACSGEDLAQPRLPSVAAILLAVIGVMKVRSLLRF